MDTAMPPRGPRLRAMVRLMLLSLAVMLVAIVTLCLAPLGMAPLIAASLYGRGLAAAINGCLADAEVSPGDVDMILSGSANTDVDECLEAAAVRSVFGAAAPPVVSTKGHIGHAMGAAAMFDVALGMEMFRRGRAPAAFAAAGDFSDGIRSILCTGIGLNGLFGAVLVRRAHWQGEGVRWFPG